MKVDFSEKQLDYQVIYPFSLIESNGLILQRLFILLLNRSKSEIPKR